MTGGGCHILMKCAGTIFYRRHYESKTVSNISRHQHPHQLDHLIQDFIDLMPGI
jgi:hypothetical protein